MPIEPYLFFEGRCDEAIEFYRKALDAEVTSLMRYKENPDPANCPAGAEDKVMHAVIRIGDSTIMVSDGMCDGNPTFNGFALTIAVSEQTEAERHFAGLSEGGRVLMPLGKTFFASCFAMLEDRFGVSWMIIVMP